MSENPKKIFPGLFYSARGTDPRGLAMWKQVAGLPFSPMCNTPLVYSPPSGALGLLPVLATVTNAARSPRL